MSYSNYWKLKWLLTKSELGIHSLDFSVEQRRKYIGQDNLDDIKTFKGPSDPNVKILKVSNNESEVSFLDQFSEKVTLADLLPVTQSEYFILLGYLNIALGDPSSLACHINKSSRVEKKVELLAILQRDSF